jgi:outer membrane protein
MMTWRLCAYAAVVGLLGTAWCRGAHGNLEDANEPTVYLGASAIVSSKPYEGVDMRVYPIPTFAYEGRRLYMRGVVGGYRLWAGKGWSIGPILQPRFDGFDADDSRTLRGMDDRRWSVDAGIGLSWLTDFGLFGLSYVTDILGRHKGQEMEFSYTALFRFGGFDFIPSAGMRWKSENLVDYYYGVRPGEALPGRPAYEGEEALDPFVRLAVRRRLTQRWSLLAAVQYEWLNSEITDSPIVDSDYQASFIAGVLYAW